MDLLKKNGILGLFLVFVVLALFLRPSLAFLVSIGIPVSFAGAIMMMPYTGISINMISLFAFILVLGILVATLANHFLAGSLGVWLAQLVSPESLRWIVALSFFAFALWALKPDRLDGERALPATGVFVATLIAFFVVEMGDKTQLATIALAAHYEALVAVVLGTTLGMMIANVPAVWIGESLTQRVSMTAMRWVAAALFVVLGVLALAVPG